MTTRKRNAPLTPRTKLNQALTKHLVADFAAYGAEVIAKLRKEKPVDYVKLVTSILQKGEAADVALDAGYDVIERRVIRPDCAGTIPRANAPSE